MFVPPAVTTQTWSSLVRLEAQTGGVRLRDEISLTEDKIFPWMTSSMHLNAEMKRPVMTESPRPLEFYNNNNNNNIELRGSIFLYIYFIIHH